MSPSPRAWILCCGALGAGLALLGQCCSPFHLLAHETSQLFAVLGSFGLLLAGRPLLHLAPEVRWTTLFTGGLAAGLGLTATLELVNQLVYACNGAGTHAFFWITWVPLALFFSTLGTALATRKLRWKIAFFAFLVATTLVHDALQQLLAARTVDPFIGLPLFLNQRADMDLPLIHVLSRGWFASVGLALALGAWARILPPVRPVAALAATFAVALTFFGGSHVGVGIGPAAIRQTLDGTRTSEHFVFRYASKGRTAVRMDAIEREAEWRLHLLTQTWEVEPPGPIELLIFDGREELYEGTGMTWAHASYGRAAMAWWDALDGTLAHELVHVVHPQISWHPWLAISPGYLEGTAMAFDDHGYAFLPEAHSEIAAASEQGNLPSASVLMHPLGFTTVNEGNAYRFAGSFMGFLVLEHGIPKFKEFQRTLDYQAVYGASLEQMDQAWRTWLTTVPRTNLETARARERFDPAQAPGVYDQRCPRLDVLQRTPAAEASAWADERAYAGAASRFAALWEQDPQPRWAWGAVSALQAVQDHEGALRLLADLPAGPPDQQLRALNARIVSLLALERWEELYAAFAEREQLEPPPLERQHLQRLLHDPTIRERLGRVLLSREPWFARPELEQLQREHPDDPGWSVLLVERGSPVANRRTGLHPGDAEPWGAWIGWANEAGTCDEKELERGFLQLVDVQDCENAEALLLAMERNCTAGAGKVAAQRSRERWSTPLYTGCP